MLGGLYIAAERQAPSIEIATPIINISDSPAAAVSEEATLGTQPAEQPQQPVSSSAGTPASKAAVRKKSPKLKPKQARPYQEALEKRLEQTDFTRGDFMAVAETNEWLNKSYQSLDDVPDEQLQVFLQPDEWEVVIGEIEKLRQ